MDEKKAPTPRVDVKIIKSSSMDTPTVFYEQQKVEKSDRANSWIRPYRYLLLTGYHMPLICAA